MSKFLTLTNNVGKRIEKKTRGLTSRRTNVRNNIYKKDESRNKPRQNN